MTKNTFLYIMPLVCVLFLSFRLWEKKHIKIYLVGDSTMATKQVRAYPETGWGMPFVVFFDSTVTVDNRAKNGRSTKSFITEKLWQPVVDSLQEGDYVFIQFGHNDEVPTKATFTTPSEFSANLGKYVSEARSKKAVPVLITPVARRKFDSTAHLQSTHEAYSALVRSAAKKFDTPLIDLDLKSQQLLQQLGPESSKLLFNYLEPDQHPNYPQGIQDDTHFSELGARKMAELVLKEIRNLDLEITSRIVNRKVK